MYRPTPRKGEDTAPEPTLLHRYHGVSPYRMRRLREAESFGATLFREVKQRCECEPVPLTFREAPAPRAAA